MIMQTVIILFVFSLFLLNVFGPIINFIIFFFLLELFATDLEMNTDKQFAMPYTICLLILVAKLEMSHSRFQSN